MFQGDDKRRWSSVSLKSIQECARRDNILFNFFFSSCLLMRSHESISRPRLRLLWLQIGLHIPSKLAKYNAGNLSGIMGFARRSSKPPYISKLSAGRFSLIKLGPKLYGKNMSERNSVTFSFLLIWGTWLKVFIFFPWYTLKPLVQAFHSQPRLHFSFSSLPRRTEIFYSFLDSVSSVKGNLINNFSGAEM